MKSTFTYILYMLHWINFFLRPPEKKTFKINDFSADNWAWNKKLENNLTEESILQSTSCGRFNRTKELLTENRPENMDDCIRILKDEKVMMGITVQQMVFDNETGEIRLIKTCGW